MKCTIPTAFAALMASLTIVETANIELAGSVINSAAKEGFENSRTLVYGVSGPKRAVDGAFEPDPNRNYTLQDGLIFLLQCTTAGFRPECLSFGSPPGRCGLLHVHFSIS